MIKEYDICHTSCYSNLEYELETLSRVCKVSFDFSDEHDDDYMKRVCPFVTYAFFSGSDMSEEEIHALAKKAAGYGTKIIGITRGSKGSVFYDGTEFYTQGICKVDVVDAMGAGDAFITAFLLTHHRGKSLTQSLQAGADFAAVACGFNGAFGSPLVL